MTRLPTGRGRRALVGALAAAVLVLVVLLLTRSVGGEPTATAPTAGPTADPSAAPAATPAATPRAPTDEPGATGTPTQPAPGPEPTGPAAELAEAVATIEAGQTHLPPVGAGEIARIGSGVTVVLDDAEPVKAQASGPGEVAGPAVALTVTITNGGTGSLTLDDVVVNLYGQEGAPGSLFPSDPRTRPLAGELAPGARSTGTYVLSVPSSSNGQLIVSVSVGVDVPTPLFTTVLEES